jgi:hypothetical protein
MAYVIQMTLIEVDVDDVNDGCDVHEVDVDDDNDECDVHEVDAGDIGDVRM